MESIVTVTSAASSIDLTTPAAVKLELDITSNDSDAWLAQAVTRASAAAASYCHRVFPRQTYSEQLRRNGCETVEKLKLARYPVSSITSVTEDGTAIIAGDYELDAESGMLYRLSSGSRTCWGAAKIVVVYVAGYVTVADPDAMPDPIVRNVPANLEMGVIRFVTKMRAERSRDPSLRALDIPGVQSETFWVGSVGENGALTPEIEGLWASFIDWSV